ncbi:hypothetical protein OIU76_007246 [Salix suchowensis]|nr:hypothetical protein OIU76_007246 [Salix suchowensis]
MRLEGKAMSLTAQRNQAVVKLKLPRFDACITVRLLSFVKTLATYCPDFSSAGLVGYKLLYYALPPVKSLDGHSPLLNPPISFSFFGRHLFFSHGSMVAEVSRVLRPGGVFVATTYILDGPFSFIPFLKPISQSFTQASGSKIFLSERELEDVCRACGLVNFTCTRNSRFIMFCATKPI